MMPLLCPVLSNSCYHKLGNGIFDLAHHLSIPELHFFFFFDTKSVVRVSSLDNLSFGGTIQSTIVRSSLTVPSISSDLQVVNHGCFSDIQFLCSLLGLVLSTLTSVNRVCYSLSVCFSQTLWSEWTY